MNPFKGEGEFIVGEDHYALTIDIEAMIRAEQLTGQTIGELINGFAKVSLGAIRALLWAGMRTHREIPPAEVADLIGAAGIDVAHAAVTKALSGALPRVEEQDGDAHPPKAADGTGSRGSRGGARKG